MRSIGPVLYLTLIEKHLFIRDKNCAIQNLNIFLVFDTNNGCSDP